MNCIGLPPDTLEGHRIRFLKQFKALRQFYLQSSTLQYFKTLIQVPNLDEVSFGIVPYFIHFTHVMKTIIFFFFFLQSPPNFLISSELSRHVTPVVILPNEALQPPQVEETLVQLESDIPERNDCSPDLLLERCEICFE